MLSSCGARLIFGHDKLNLERASAHEVSQSISGQSCEESQRNYCITGALGETSHNSSDHLEFTFSSGGQSLLVERENSSITTSKTASSGGGKDNDNNNTPDQINRIGRHEFALVSSGEYHQLGLNSSSRFTRELELECESERRTNDNCRRQFNDLLPQAPRGAQVAGTSRLVHTSARKQAAPLPPTPPPLQRMQQQQKQPEQQVNFHHHHQSIHKKLQQIYGSRLQEIELRQQQGQGQGQGQIKQKQQLQQQRQPQRRQLGAPNKVITSMINGHTADCMAHSRNGLNHGQHLEQATYDSLVSINPVRPPAPPQPSLESNETSRDNFYEIRAQGPRNERAVPKTIGAAAGSTSGRRFLDPNEPKDDGVDDENEDDDDDDDELGGEYQFWPNNGKLAHKSICEIVDRRQILDTTHRDVMSVSEIEHKRHLASIHYATSTAAALLNAAASATAAIATGDQKLPTRYNDNSHHKSSPLNLRPIHCNNNSRQQVKQTPYAIHRPVPIERPYQQIYCNNNQGQRQRLTQEQAAYLQWQGNRQLAGQTRPATHQVYQVYTSNPSYGPQGIGSRVPMPPPVTTVGANFMQQQLKLQQQQQQQQQQSGRQIPGGELKKTNSNDMLRAMTIIQNEKKRVENQQRREHQKRPHVVSAHDARLVLNAARLKQANRIYDNNMANQMANYQQQQRQQQQRALMLAACKPARNQVDAQKEGQIYAATAGQLFRVPPPRPVAPIVPLLPVIYNRLAPQAKYASDDEGAHALLSGSSSSGDSGCHLGSTGLLNYTSVPMIVRRNGKCKPFTANGELSLLGRMRRIDLTLFWWLLLIVCMISLGLLASLSRVLAT